MVRLLQLAVMVALRAEGSEQGRTPVGAGPPRAGSWQPAMDQELAKSPDKSLATTPTKAEGRELWASPGRSPIEVSVPRLLSTANEGTVGGRADGGPSQDPQGSCWGELWLHLPDSLPSGHRGGSNDTDPRPKTHTAARSSKLQDCVSRAHSGVLLAAPLFLVSEGKVRRAQS